MMPLVHDSHRPRTQSRLQPILPELLGFDRRLLGLALEAGNNQRKHEYRRRADRQQSEQRIKGPLQNRERMEGFGMINLRDQPQFIFGKPPLAERPADNPSACRRRDRAD